MVIDEKNLLESQGPFHLTFVERQIYIERDRQTDRQTDKYIYIYIYILREREGERKRQGQRQRYVEERSQKTVQRKHLFSFVIL